MNIDEPLLTKDLENRFIKLNPSLNNHKNKIFDLCVELPERHLEFLAYFSMKLKEVSGFSRFFGNFFHKTSFLRV